MIPDLVKAYVGPFAKIIEINSFEDCITINSIDLYIFLPASVTLIKFQSHCICCLYVCAYLRTCVCVCECACVRVFMCVYIFIYECVCVCVCV